MRPSVGQGCGETKTQGTREEAGRERQGVGQIREGRQRIRDKAEPKKARQAGKKGKLMDWGMSEAGLGPVLLLGSVGSGELTSMQQHVRVPAQHIQSHAWFGLTV